MQTALIAKVATVIDAPIDEVWKALIDPEKVRQYMFGAEVISDFKEGSSISWKGNWKGRAFVDRGQILRVVPNRTLRYSHFSPLTGKPDRAENYHNVTIELAKEPNGTRVMLSQDNNANEEERAHSEQNWGTMLKGLKTLLEGGGGQPGAHKTSSA